MHDIESTDPFQNLGVERTSTPEEVASHFKKLAMLYHPDRPGGDEENFQKITKAKEAVLLRLGEKTEDDVAEDVTHHDAEYTYNEEAEEWEYKRGKMRVYDDYVDTGVERQRITVYMVQFAIVVSAAWLLLDNALEMVYSNVVQQDSMNKEGRMFAASKRREYEKEADVRFIAKYKRGTEENSTYTYAFRSIPPPPPLTFIHTVVHTHTHTPTTQGDLRGGRSLRERPDEAGPFCRHPRVPFVPVSLHFILRDVPPLFWKVAATPLGMDTPPPHLTRAHSGAAFPPRNHTKHTPPNSSRIPW